MLMNKCLINLLIVLLINAYVTSISCTLTREGPCHALRFDRGMQSLDYAVTGGLAQRLGSVKWLSLGECGYFIRARSR